MGQGKRLLAPSSRKERSCPVIRPNIVITASPPLVAIIMPESNLLWTKKYYVIIYCPCWLRRHIPHHSALSEHRKTSPHFEERSDGPKNLFCIECKILPHVNTWSAPRKKRWKECDAVKITSLLTRESVWYLSRSLFFSVNKTLRIFMHIFFYFIYCEREGMVCSTLFRCSVLHTL